MITKSKLSRSSLAVTLILALFSTHAVAQKPTKPGGGGGGGDTTPVPAGTIHFSQDNADMTMKADGSAKTQIGLSEQGNGFEPSHQLHGGQRWFLNLRDTGVIDEYGSMKQEIFAVTLAGETVQLTDEPDLWINYFRLAQDDSFVSYVVADSVTWDESLFVADIDWSSGMPVTGAPRLVLKSGYYSGDPQLPALGAYDWSPAGDEMVYNDIRDGDSYEIRVARFLANGTVETRHVGYGFYPTWSPDGTWIAYGSQVEGAIWKIRPDGSGAVQLSTLNFGQQHTDQVWSPDSQHLAFTQKTRTTSTKRGITTYTYTYDILRISASGGTAVNLTGDTTANCWPIGWR